MELTKKTSISHGSAFVCVCAAGQSAKKKNWCHFNTLYLQLVMINSSEKNK